MTDDFSDSLYRCSTIDFTTRLVRGMDLGSERMTFFRESGVAGRTHTISPSKKPYIDKNVVDPETRTT